MKKELVSLVGLGKLGLCLAACLAEKGFKTIGVDVDEQVVTAVNQGKAPWFEPGLDRLLARHGGKALRATLDHREAIAETDITFLLLATPTNDSGGFSNIQIESALRSLSGALRESNKEHHLFVISSTVMPGSTEDSFIPLIEQVSGRKLNQGFSVCFDPDFVALGKVIHDFFNPDMVVIGESTAASGKRLEAIHRQMCANKPAYFHMSIRNAELAKVCLNAYITTKISFVNSLANLCEKIPGMDVDAITTAIGADRRISPHYFQGGLAYGGSCFPRDTHAYLTIAKKYDVQADIIHAVDQVNQFQNRHLAQTVLQELEGFENKTVAVLGLAFTMNTPVIVESPAIRLIGELLDHNIRVVVYDPLAVDNTRGVFNNAVEYAGTPEGCLEKAGLAVLPLRNAEIKKAVEAFAPAQPLLVLDCWRMINPERVNDLVRVLSLGKGTAEETLGGE